MHVNTVLRWPTLKRTGVQRGQGCRRKRINLPIGAANDDALTIRVRTGAGQVRQIEQLVTLHTNHRTMTVGKRRIELPASCMPLWTFFAIGIRWRDAHTRDWTRILVLPAVSTNVFPIQERVGGAGYAR